MKHPEFPAPVTRGDKTAAKLCLMLTYLGGALGAGGLHYLILG
jgi:hypothetical protein